MGTYDKQEAPIRPNSIDAPLAKARSAFKIVKTEADRSESERPRLKISHTILLGDDIGSGEVVYWNPEPDRGAPNPHVLIVGESGHGKTYTASCLVAELVQIGIPSIIFDYGQGFSLKHASEQFRDWAHAVELEINRDGIALNPLEILPADLHGPATVAQRVADTMLRVYPRMGVQQHALVRRAVLEVLSEVGITQHDRSSWKAKPPTFRNLERKLNDYASSSHVTNRRVAASAASHVSALFVFDTFRSTGPKLSWSDLLDKPNQVWIIQIGGLESSVEQAVTEFLLWSFVRFMEAQGPGPLRCFIVLDEAHRLSFATGSPVEKLLREGRKFGVGVLLSSQQPEDFSSVAFANTATKVVFQIADDRGAVSKQLQRRTKSSNTVMAVSDTITRLPRGCAYVVTENIGQVVRIADFKRRASIWRSREKDRTHGGEIG
jgi:DNA phosphorothioation-dependent restriction protein DptH